MSQVLPWYRKFNNTWYVQIGTRQIPLAKGKANKAEAYQRFTQLMAQQDAAALHDESRLNVASLADVFLEWSEKKVAPKTFEWYRTYLQKFCSVHGLQRVLDLKPLHVNRWLDTHNWSDSTRRGVITIIKRMLSWAYEEGYLSRHPLQFLKRPACGKRTALISDEMHEQMLLKADPQFAQYLTALRETGARPGEVSQVTAADVDVENRVWILTNHKTSKQTGRPRLILLNDVMWQLTQELMERQPTGPLFRNRLKQPWTGNAIRCRFRRLRIALKLPAGIVAYSYRHTYATEGLVNGVPIASMAELMGHSDTKMLSQHYAHLNLKLDHLHRAARQARQ